MSPQLVAYARYMPIEHDALEWGVHVIDAGFSEIPANTPYPPARHPDTYMFTWQRGRVLQEYQIVYITAGRGIFESGTAGGLPISAGQAFALFPGVWHRYRPLKKTGWDENWIGFDGEHARRIMNRFFSPETPVLNVGHDEELLRVIRSVAELMQTSPPGYQQMMAAQAIQVLARARSLEMGMRDADGEIAAKMREAKCLLIEHAEGDPDLKQVASMLGMSYTRFRTVFKEQTGFSPHQYRLEVKINKAKAMLKQTPLTVTEIADRLGFSSVYYFSRLFKSKTGQSPCRYRSDA